MTPASSPGGGTLTGDWLDAGVGMLPHASIGEGGRGAQRRGRGSVVRISFARGRGPDHAGASFSLYDRRIASCSNGGGSNRRSGSLVCRDHWCAALLCGRFLGGEGVGTDALLAGGAASPALVRPKASAGAHPPNGPRSTSGSAKTRGTNQGWIPNRESTIQQQQVMVSPPGRDKDAPSPPAARQQDVWSGVDLARPATRYSRLISPDVG